MRRKYGYRIIVMLIMMKTASLTLFDDRVHDYDNQMMADSEKATLNLNNVFLFVCLFF